MKENEFILNDRIAKIKAMDDEFNLLDEAYVSFSGGKDSAVLSKLIDLALPGNNIPRVFFNTGLEYRQTVEHIVQEMKEDERVAVFNSEVNIQEIWKKFGYPIKSKQHSHILHIFQNSGKTKSVRKYLGEEKANTKLLCPKKLKYQFSEDFEIKASDICCTKLKKQVARRFESKYNYSISITGMRASEGGQRKNMAKCAVFSEAGKLKRFSPLLVVEENWIEWFLEEFKIRLSSLYEEPFYFKRTGCAGCPYTLNLYEQLSKLMEYDLRSFKMIWRLWQPIYEEYARIGYRKMDEILRKKNEMGV